jgi:two-component system response regulator NreC
VLDGQRYLCDDAQAALGRVGACSGGGDDLPSPTVLTEREREVLRFLAHGEHTKAIAAALAISPKTVETHRQHITRKLGTANVAALVRYAIRHGLVRS